MCIYLIIELIKKNIIAVQLKLIWHLKKKVNKLSENNFSK